MVHRTERFKAFVKLGAFLREYTERCTAVSSTEQLHGTLHRQLEEQLELAVHRNRWFTPQNIRIALASWGEALYEEKLVQWLSPYPISKTSNRKVAIIMAGNIPLVGLHDLLTVLITNNSALIKTSSDDRVLLPLLAEFLIGWAPELKKAVVFEEGILKGFDAVIATGSNNTARYFEYYFGGKPNIIRKNRNSVAVLQGGESMEELGALGKDIFTYFGLGCRNVAKLYVPEQYDFDSFFKAIAPFSGITGHNKYANNYEYNKAVYLMSNYRFLDNGFLLLREDPAYSSPIGTLNYERYKSRKELLKKLESDKSLIQCVVGKPETGAGIPFGQTQNPALWDYADGVDTVDFLLKT
jgi:hypothetical protein